MKGSENRKEHFYNVAYDLQPVQEQVVWKDVLIKESMWAYSREQSAKEKMRLCYDDITQEVEGSLASQSCEYANELIERFSEEKLYAQFVEAVLPAEELKQLNDEIEGLLNDLL